MSRILRPSFSANGRCMTLTSIFESSRAYTDSFWKVTESWMWETWSSSWLITTIFASLSVTIINVEVAKINTSFMTFFWEICWHSCLFACSCSTQCGSGPFSFLIAMTFILVNPGLGLDDKDNFSNLYWSSTVPIKSRAARPRASNWVQKRVCKSSWKYQIRISLLGAAIG